MKEGGTPSHGGVGDFILSSYSIVILLFSVFFSESDYTPGPASVSSN